MLWWTLGHTCLFQFWFPQCVCPAVGLLGAMSLRVGYDWAASLSLSCIGEGNGNPLQCSCLENPRDGGAWWAAVYGVAQSQTRLKWLSSSSSISYLPPQHRDHSRMAPFRTLSHSSSAQIFWSSQLIVFTVFTVFQTQPGTRRQGGGDRRNVEFFPTLFNVSFLSSVPHSCTLISHL